MKSQNPTIQKFASLLTFAAVLLIATPALQAAALAPIQEIEGTQPTAPAFGAWTEPVVIATAADAEKHFEGAALETLKANVDFEHQIVLVFSWRGSGQDKLTHEVAESAPEQITFARQFGRTKDLRQHVKIFALRKDVKWSTR